MGPNKQKRPATTPGNGGRGGSSGGGRGGRGGQQQSAYQQRRSTFLSRGSNPNAMRINENSRNMIIDVLQHIATGGEAAVPEAHFDPNAAHRVTMTFRKNVRLSPLELLQLWFEKNGFPPDVTTQFLSEVPNPPQCENMVDLQRDHKQWLARSCFDLVAIMVWTREEENGENTEGNGQHQQQQLQDDDDDDDDNEESNARAQELELLSDVYSDIACTVPPGVAAELGLDPDDEVVQFRLLTADGVSATLTVKLLPNYPADPPLVLLQSDKSISPQARRCVLDTAVNVISSMRTMPCLMALVGACRDALAERTALEASAAAAKAQVDGAAVALRDAKANEAKEREKQRVAFVGALAAATAPAPTAPSGTAVNSGSPTTNPAAAGIATTNKTNKNNNSSTNTNNPSSAAADSSSSASPRFGEGAILPAPVKLDTVDAAASAPEKRARDQFLRRDQRLDADLKRRLDELARNGTHNTARANLPAAAEKKHLMELLDRNDCVVVGGETGCGKTTQVPQFILEHAIESGAGSACQIIVTQPRRLAATAVALRVADEREEPIGGLVGYNIRLENKSSSRTKILYCTTGVLLRRLQSDPWLGNVSHIVIDEIHERGVDTDFLLIIIKDLMAKRNQPSAGGGVDRSGVNQNLKVVLMSATMNAELFSTYFNGAPVISIAGRTHPVTVHFLEEIVTMTKYTVEEGGVYSRPIDDETKQLRAKNKNRHLSAVDSAVNEFGEDAIADRQVSEFTRHGASQKAAETLARMNLDILNYELIEHVVAYIDSAFRDVEGAILVFLPGLAEIQKCLDELRSNTALASRFLFFNLHSSIGSAEQGVVFQRPPKGKRKCVLGTNIMETSITIEDCVFVIDTGKFKENRYDARKSLSQLVTCWVSKANASQRQGRAGRVRPGHCFRLYSTPQFEAFEDHQVCEMHRVPLESLVLQITVLNLGDEVEYLSKALTPPQERAIRSSVSVLKGLGALTQEKRLTSLGYHLANLPIDVRIGKIIIHGAVLRCLDPVLTIAACLAVRSPFISSYEDQGQIEAIRNAFARGQKSDQLAAWHAYHRWISLLHTKGDAAARQLCRDAFLSLTTLPQIQATKKQYERYLVDAGFVSQAQNAADMDDGGADNPNDDGRSGNSRRQSGRRQQGGARGGGGGGHGAFAFPPWITGDDLVFEAGGAVYNAHSSNVKCILACLVAGLYPNIARVQTFPKGQKLVGFDGADLMIHPSSVNAKERSFGNFPFVMYVDKVKTSQTFLRETSVVSPYSIVLFGGELKYLANYGELAVDSFVSFECSEQDGVLLMHMRQQLDSALSAKINDPSARWESTSDNLVRAMVRILTEETSANAFVVIDKSQRRALTAPFVDRLGGASGTSNSASGEASTATPTSGGKPSRAASTRMCFNCGETGHLSRDCTNDQRLSKARGGPTVCCFICGTLVHHPADCPHAKQPESTDSK